MPKTRVEEGSEYFFDEGDFLARMTQCTEEQVDFIYKSHHKAVQRGTAKVGEKGEFAKWTWTWALLEGPQSGSTLDVSTDPGISLKGASFARNIYEALIGHEVELDEDIDTDLVEGLTARIVLTHEDPIPRRDGQGNYFGTRVSDVFNSKDGTPATSGFQEEPPF